MLRILEELNLDQMNPEQEIGTTKVAKPRKAAAEELPNVHDGLIVDYSKFT